MMVIHNVIYYIFYFIIVLFSVQHVGLRRGDIVVALKLSSGDGGGRAMDVRWETCRRVAELIVHQHQRLRRASSGDGAVVVQLKVVTPITAAVAYDSYPPAEPNKVDSLTSLSRYLPTHKFIYIYIHFLYA
jgi:hypothetical protein